MLEFRCKLCKRLLFIFTGSNLLIETVCPRCNAVCTLSSSYQGGLVLGIQEVVTLNN